MLTADTITESHVRRVWEEYPNAITGREVMAALNEPHITGHAWSADEIRAAREKCASILNAAAGVTRCTGCEQPAHASETDDDGYHPQCRPAHDELQHIPVVGDPAIVVLFDAALAAQAGALDLHESLRPGAGAALIAWARSRGLRIDERHYVVEYSRPYANVRVSLGGSSLNAITVLGFRELTDDEIAAITVETRERKPERIGYGEARL